MTGERNQKTLSRAFCTIVDEAMMAPVTLRRNFSVSD
jgi:hypothetical protein